MDSPFPHGFDAHGDIALAGDEDNGHAGFRLAELGLQIHPAPPRHLHVEKNASDAFEVLPGKELFGGGERFHRVPYGSQEPRQALPNGGIVINYEYNRVFFGHCHLFWDGLLSWNLFIVHHGQFESEYGPAMRMVLPPDSPAMRLDNGLAYRKPHP